MFLKDESSSFESLVVDIFKQDLEGPAVAKDRGQQNDSPMTLRYETN